uniref:C3H1-type domain-containing protein n=1 Tax=Pyrodinium bahamense TaxID=73915 RepID=A0A7S0A853_9DINO
MPAPIIPHGDPEDGHMLWGDSDDGNSSVPETENHTAEPFVEEESCHLPTSQDKDAGKGNVICLSDAMLPSEGSALHATGSCRPCNFITRSKRCERGSRCCFCHDTVHIQRTVRPSRTKREQYRRLVQRLFDEVETNPKAFDRETRTFSPSLIDMIPNAFAMNQQLMKKLSRRLEVHALNCTGEPTYPVPSNISAEATWQSLYEGVDRNQVGVMYAAGPWKFQMLSF